MFTWDLNPVLLHAGPLEIRYYGVFFALALGLAYSLGRKMVEQKKLSVALFDELALYLIIGLVAGARFGHILFYELDYYLANPTQIIKVWQGGLSSHGATIGVILAYALFLWKNRLGRKKIHGHKEPAVKFFDFADIIVIVTCIPASLVRIGNFFNSELVGRVTNVEWGTIFARVDELPRHPSQLYEALMGAVIFVILYLLWTRKYGWPWEKTVADKRSIIGKKTWLANLLTHLLTPKLFVGLFFVLYFAGRFCVEFFKDFPLHEGFFNLTTGQILSLPFLILGIAMLASFIKYSEIHRRR